MAERRQPWHRWLKKPMMLLLIVVGFIFEFIVELPFRVAMWIARERD